MELRLDDKNKEIKTIEYEIFSDLIENKGQQRALI